MNQWQYQRSCIALSGYAAADNQRWLKAAQAAEVVQNLNEYQLFEDNVTAAGYGFYRVFTLRKLLLWDLEIRLKPRRG